VRRSAGSNINSDIRKEEGRRKKEEGRRKKEECPSVKAI